MKKCMALLFLLPMGTVILEAALPWPTDRAFALPPQEKSACCVDCNPCKCDPCTCSEKKADQKGCCLAVATALTDEQLKGEIKHSA